MTSFPTQRVPDPEDCSKGEHWRCKCGASYKGEGAIKKGRRHNAAEILAALDEAGVLA